MGGNNNFKHVNI